MHEKNLFAVALGKMAKGKPKNYSMEELLRRSIRLIEMNKSRKGIKKHEQAK